MMMMMMMMMMIDDRVQLIRDQSKSECVDGCSGKWKRGAEQVLANNGLERRSYCGAVYDLLEKRRGKYRNILITGTANCAKTFMLLPLTVSFKCFPSRLQITLRGSESNLPKLFY